MNEYFIKVCISYYQELSDTETFFVNAETGKDAWCKLEGQIWEKNEDWMRPEGKKITNVTLLDIRKL